MTFPKILALASWLSLAATQACSSSKALGTTGGASGGASGMSGARGASGVGGDAGAEQCAAPGYHVDSTAIEVDEVQALVHDPSGAPVAELPIQVCGTDRCTYGMSNAAGKVDVLPATTLTLPAFKYGDGFQFAELAIPLDQAKQNLGTLVALPLPSYADGAAFPSSGKVTNGDVTLFIDSTTSVVHDTLSYDDSELVFRTVAIPVADSSQALDPKFGFELAYAVAPLGTLFCPPARLSLKNTLAWDAGSPVEMFVQGVNTDEQWAPYGSWVKVADGAVSSDARSIDTTSGGITVLSSIAVRRK